MKALSVVNPNGYRVRLQITVTTRFTRVFNPHFIVAAQYQQASFTLL